MSVLGLSYSRSGFLQTTVLAALLAAVSTLDLAVDQPPAAAPDDEINWSKEKQFWSFQRPTAHPAPPVQNKSWPTQPIDFFILAKLEQKGLAPSPPADKTTLIRRVTFDLTGLPPTAEDVANYLSDNRPDAYARVV